MLHNYQYKFLSISRCRYLRLIVPLCSICTFLCMNLGNKCYAAVNPTASLSVSNPTLSTTVAPGDTAYLSSNVTYSASDIDSYTLQVSYANGYSSLKLDGGTTTLTGANGTSGSSLTNNSWGFAWTNNTTNNTSTNAGLTYYTVPTYGTNGSGISTGRLESATLPDSANNTLDSTTKRIVFAAKFAENNNNSGHYKTGVQLSMVAAPRKLIGLEKANTMQDLATHPEYCEETPLLDGQKYSAEYKLMDNRAYPSGVSNQYAIRKFADGRCWMTENLRINNTTIKATDSDFTTATVSSGEITLPNSSKSDFANNDTSKYSYQSYLSTPSDGASAGVSGYYNWYTATAGAGTSGVTSGTVGTSICPKGWTLPTGGKRSDTDFYKLFRNIGLTISDSLSSTNNNDWGAGDLVKVQTSTDSNSKVIYNFKYTGRIFRGSLIKATSSGYWWSGSVGSIDLAYLLLLDSSYIRPGSNLLDRDNGFALRCIARDPDLSEITTMQEMTPRVCEKTTVGTSKTLTDTRDGNTYTVRKFADSTTDPKSGRCWMTENLRITGRTIKATESDFTTDTVPSGDITLPNSGKGDFANNDTSKYSYQSYLSTSSDGASAGVSAYYNWYTATAGAGNSSETTNNKSLNTSICPKGWTLPTGGSASDANTESTWSDYYKLFRNMGLTISNANLKPGYADYTNWGTGDLAIVQGGVYNFKYTGAVVNGSLDYGTTYGFWWSSTAYSATSAYYLYMDSGGVFPGTVSYDGRYVGFAVRCIARDS